MKNRIFRTLSLAFAGLTALAFFVMPAAAQNSIGSTNAPAVAGTMSPREAKPVELSYGARDVLNLSRAHVSDDTIVAFIGSSGTIYSLSASEIVYLRDQGVSDRAITAMLDQRRKVKEIAARVTANAQVAAATPQANYSNAGTGQDMSANAQSSAVYVQAAPAYSPSTTVYVVPSPSPAYVDYGYSPYYGGYYGWYPGVSFGFGFGFGDWDHHRGGWGGFRGGGGGFHGGGFHGGGWGGHR